jgi:hypothetical protein
MLERSDGRAVREAILDLTEAEARKRGIGKSTLHYLRVNAAGERPFRTYRRVRERIVSLAAEEEQ